MRADRGKLTAAVMAVAGAIFAVAVTVALLIQGQPDRKGPLMTAQDVMRITGFSENHVYNALLDGRLPGRVQCGRRVLVNRVVFEAWLAGESAGESDGD